MTNIWICTTSGAPGIWEPLPAVNYNITFGSRLSTPVSTGWPTWNHAAFASQINWFDGDDIVWGPAENDKKCICLISDLMVQGCTCGGN